MKNYVMYNGLEIPSIGFGTWQIPDGEVCYKACLDAFEAGYRHVDTAYVYGNEKSVGRAIKDFGINREEIFVTTKLPSDIKSFDGCIKYFNESLENLGLQYVDLYLIHAPWPWSNVGSDCTSGNIEAWKAMIELMDQGKIKSIGVSNFLVKDIKALIEATGIKPMVNQIRYFIGNTQEEITQYCQNNDILVEAYSPLATGHILENEFLIAMSKKYNVTVAKICLKYCLQKNTLPIPKSTNKERIKANIELDFVIDEEDMKYLDSLYHIGPVRELRS